MIDVMKIFSRQMLNNGCPPDQVKQVLSGLQRKLNELKGLDVSRESVLALCEGLVKSTSNYAELLDELRDLSQMSVLRIKVDVLKL